MENVRRMARSGSVKMTEMLRIPSKTENSAVSDNEEQMEKNGEEMFDEDCETPSTLPILRVAGREGTKQQRREKLERENKDKVNGSAPQSGPAGKICYGDVIHLLTCPVCTCLASAPVSQCKRGHVVCKECSRSISSCPLCRQPLIETPNNTLDKIINLIALPCKYGSQGCSIVTFQSERLKHQTICEFRPLPCQYSSHGCSMVLAVKDLPWHHKQCTFAALKDDLELEADEVEEVASAAPAMPSRKKGSMKAKK